MTARNAERIMPDRLRVTHEKHARDKELFEAENADLLAAARAVRDSVSKTDTLTGVGPGVGVKATAYKDAPSLTKPKDANTFGRPNSTDGDGIPPRASLTVAADLASSATCVDFRGILSQTIGPGTGRRGGETA